MKQRVLTVWNDSSLDWLYKVMLTRFFSFCFSSSNNIDLLTHLHKTLIAGSGWHLLNLDFGKLLDLYADVSNL